MKKIRKYLNDKIKNPAYKLILATINHNRLLIIINFNANVLASAFEGSTFGLIFLALSILENERRTNIVENPIIQNTFLINIFESLSRGQLFVSLIILAILAQILKNLLAYIGAVSSDYLGAKIRVEMTETLFRQIMLFSFPCASTYKVGDLTNYVTQAGGTVTTEVTLYNNLIVNFFTTILIQLFYFLFLFLFPL